MVKFPGTTVDWCSPVLEVSGDSRPFLSYVKLRDYGVLWYAQNARKERLKRGAEPESLVAICDPVT